MESYLNLSNIRHSADGVERHPLVPFLPPDTRVLFLGSFPPQRKRWCMDFYYPNFINDHWRIEGLVFFGDKNHFVDEAHRTFKLADIVAFLREKGIGFFDTATAVRRLADNASDKFLEVVTPTDIRALTAPLRQLRAIVTTGEKAARTVCEALDMTAIPATGTSSVVSSLSESGRQVRLWRLPSSSRAYPLPLEKKAAAYAMMFRAEGLL